jgi:hypothetical protein
MMIVSEGARTDPAYLDDALLATDRGPDSTVAWIAPHMAVYPGIADFQSMSVHYMKSTGYVIITGIGVTILHTTTHLVRACLNDCNRHKATLSFGNIPNMQNANHTARSVPGTLKTTSDYITGNQK